MGNITPNSQLSANECFQWQIRENQEEEEGNTSCQESHNIGIKGTTVLLNGLNSIPPLFEDSPSQGSTQKYKRRTSEEA
ncbi:hypothetical protein O181_004262 [Austropuccinia psidii MF-1]|uniref:Uncharacterized protein n=1 Tax=Austropuccinia psidii MF-1 TaxID=1389203 RepID=A0A9Q3GFL9_9BASI|nr:hypothetical protein [Austropuccinia psidii MF-1]